VQNNLSATITTSVQTRIHIYITDVSGNVLKEIQQNLERGDNSIQLNVSSLRTGSYFIKAMDANMSAAAMFNKQ
jgi:hypothetical protein